MSVCLIAKRRQCRQKVFLQFMLKCFRNPVTIKAKMSLKRIPPDMTCGPLRYFHCHTYILRGFSVHSSHVSVSVACPEVLE